MAERAKRALEEKEKALREEMLRQQRAEIDSIADRQGSLTWPAFLSLWGHGPAWFSKRHAMVISSSQTVPVF